LPDGIFSNQKSQIGHILGALEKDNAYIYILWPFGIFKNIWYVLWPFGIFRGHLVNFPRFCMLYLEKSGNPGLGNAFWRWAQIRPKYGRIF
jgi:hypothetical protein